MTINLKLLILVFTCTQYAACDLKEQKKFLNGTYTIYTKHPECEIVKTQAIFGRNFSFILFSTCGSQEFEKLRNENSEKGKWAFLNDSIVEVIFVKRPSMKFKIECDTILELQGGGNFRGPHYIKE